MSRKNFCLDRRRDLFLEIQPTVVVASLERLGWLSHSHEFLCADGGDAIEFERAASETGAQGQPWFYLRLVAYGFFRLSEGA